MENANLNTEKFIDTSTVDSIINGLKEKGTLEAFANSEFMQGNENIIENDEQIENEIQDTIIRLRNEIIQLRIDTGYALSTDWNNAIKESDPQKMLTCIKRIELIRKGETSVNKRITRYEKLILEIQRAMTSYKSLSKDYKANAGELAYVESQSKDGAILGTLDIASAEKAILDAYSKGIRIATSALNEGMIDESRFNDIKAKLIHTKNEQWAKLQDQA